MLCFLLFSSCASLYISAHCNPGISKDVKKELIENEKSRVKRKKAEKIYKLKTQKEIKQMQKKRLEKLK